MRTPEEGKEYDDRGARYLTFRIEGPREAGLNLVGYVPGAALQGDETAEWNAVGMPISDAPLFAGRTDYETEVVVGDPANQHYRFAVASGEWKKVASVPLDLGPEDRIDFRREPTGKRTIAKGPWGRLVQDAGQIDALRKANGYSGPGPSVL